MNLEEKAQKLHDRATRGEQLLAEEQTALQNWYDELDRAEDLLINKNTDGSNLFELREQLGAKLREVSQAALEVERIARQNEVIRRENERLREAVESRLLEKAA
jgi:hypothetical protein